MRDHGKRVRAEPIQIKDDRLVAAVEMKLSEEAARGGWRMSKKRPIERHDLIVLARNLGVMREALPHGEKSRVLLNADFSGADPANAATYANNLTLTPGSGTPTADRLRRLSPRVQRYIDVAVGIEGDRNRAIARLFRRTSLDRDLSDDWQGKLSARLDRLADEVAVDTGLARYFDEASAANVCLAEGNDLEFRATGWLSETFHKDEFAAFRPDPPEGVWLYDRAEEGTPKGGAPLFVPMIPINVRTRSWMIREDANDAEVSCTFNNTLHLAIVPIASSLHEPCQVECWLIERPSTELRSSKKNAWQVSMDGMTIQIRVEDKIYCPVDEKSFRRWSNTEEGELFVSKVGALGRQSDLLDGGWWCMPATPNSVFSRLSASRTGGRAFAPIHGKEIELVVDNVDDPEDADLHAVAPDLFPPHGTLALEMTFGMRDVEQQLKSSAETLIWRFHEFQQQVRAASPLSK